MRTPDILSTFIAEQVRLVHQNIVAELSDKEEVIQLLYAFEIESNTFIPHDIRDEFLEDAQAFLCAQVEDFQEFRMIAESVQRLSSWSLHSLRDLTSKFKEFFENALDDLAEDDEYEDKVENIEFVARILDIPTTRALSSLQDSRDDFLQRQTRQKPTEYTPNSSRPPTDSRQTIIEMFDCLV